jgi:nicotinamide-nucleotide amidase
LAERVGDLLLGRGQTLAVAESCTGGLLGDRLTDVPGSSRYFLGGVIAYSDAVKVSLLSVTESTIRRAGAVSADVARQMALGARLALGADYALAVTCYAGPDGDSGQRVGTTFIALAAPDGLWVEHFVSHGDRHAYLPALPSGRPDRQANKQAAAEAALALLLRYLEKRV